MGPKDCSVPMAGGLVGLGAAALFLLTLAACSRSFTIEPTDISAIRCYDEREKVEQLLGEPTHAKEHISLTFAEYYYDKGHTNFYREPRFLASGTVFDLITFPFFLSAYGTERSAQVEEARERQRGKLVIIYGPASRTLYAGFVERLPKDRRTLTDIAAIYQSAENGDLHARLRLGRAAHLPANENSKCP